MSREHQSLAAKLFAPVGLATFRESWVRRTPLVVHGSTRRLSALWNVPELRSVKSLIRADMPYLKAWRTEGAHLEQIHRLTPARARALWRTQEYTLVADNIDLCLPLLRQVMVSIRSHLGYSNDFQCQLSCNAYAAPPHVGTRVHFDEHEVLVVQVLGSKTWRYAPNEHVDSPTEPFFGGEPRPGLSRQLHRAPLPTTLPRAATEVELVPGSLLFLPRGTWHQPTAGPAGSLALTLTFMTQTWARVLLRAFALALETNAQLREPLSPLPDGVPDARVIRKVRAKARLAREVLEQLDRATIIEALGR